MILIMTRDIFEDFIQYSECLLSVKEDVSDIKIVFNVDTLLDIDELLLNDGKVVKYINNFNAFVCNDFCDSDILKNIQSFKERKKFN